MNVLNHYAQLIGRVLDADGNDRQKRLFDQYISLPTNDEKEAFVLALIGHSILRQSQQQIEKRRNINAR